MTACREGGLPLQLNVDIAEGDVMNAETLPKFRFLLRARSFFPYPNAPN